MLFFPEIYYDFENEQIIFVFFLVIKFHLIFSTFL